MRWKSLWTNKLKRNKWTKLPLQLPMMLTAPMRLIPSKTLKKDLDTIKLIFAAAASADAPIPRLNIWHAAASSQLSAVSTLSEHSSSSLPSSSSSKFSINFWMTILPGGTHSLEFCWLSLSLSPLSSLLSSSHKTPKIQEQDLDPHAS